MWGGAGWKLEKALQTFPLDLKGKTMIDIGASTADLQTVLYKTVPLR